MTVPLRRRVFYTYTSTKYWLEGLLYRSGVHPSPSRHVVKRQLIRAVAARDGYRVFVETGTYLGDMLAGLSNDFDELHSIELADGLFDKATQRFARSPRVRVHHGDSADVLPEILDRCTVPVLFWLDAHYSGEVTARGTEDTPVLRELGHIAAHPVRQHAILIDDAEYFDGRNAYPTIDAVRRFVEIHWPQHEMVVADDIIRITPRRPA